MDKIMGIIFSNAAICCYEGLILGFVFIRFIRLRKQRKHIVEMNTQQKEKAREEKLNQLLKNRLYRGKTDKALQSNIPYEVSFHEERTVNDKKDDGIAVQVIEKGKISTRKYIIFISDVITIGQGGDNVLIINDLKVAKNQCRITRKLNEIYIQTLEETHPVKLRRKRSVMQLTKDAVALQDNDYIELGETTLNIHFM
ncbi:MAG: FHA domain-containing protein [Lachnospiraceae bacterium]|nr:FHA domain-containing protein [Lachnospiraceae bacterium]